MAGIDTQRGEGNKTATSCISAPFMSGRSRAIALTGVLLLLVGCAQTTSYAPKPITTTYSLDNFTKGNLQVVVRDLRAERDNSDALIRAIQSQVLNSLSGGATTHHHYKLTVDVIEHRSFFYTRKLERLNPS
jgi:hypothetical protein